MLQTGVDGPRVGSLRVVCYVNPAMGVRRIVLAYSGGLDTSVILRWLVERHGAELIAFCADLGQAEELTGLEEKARATGAIKTIVEDLREEFVRDYVFPRSEEHTSELQSPYV